jgi:DNA primase
MSVVEEIKRRVDIVEVIGSYVQLTRCGRNYKGLSPFKQERTPSFFVFPETQTFKDFSSGEQGDVFSFLMKKEGLTFGEALRVLARRAGVTLEAPTPEQQRSAAYAERLRAALADAAEYFHQLLTSAPQAAACRAYLREQRGLSEATIAAWRLGYSLADFQALSAHLMARGYSAQELVDAGLVVQNEEGRRYDRFRGRLMIPIRDAQGAVVGFGARALDGSEPKYLNSPQTAVFDKGRLLFGLDRARRHIRAEQCAVLVEGYMDVIACHQAGFCNVVAGMGTALSEAQLRALRQLAPRIVLALDADAAGERAILRSIQVAREALDRESTPQFDPRGIIRHESRLRADIRVAILPADKDPDELALSAPDQWRAIITAARPVVEHVIDAMLAGHDLRDPAARSQAVRAVAPILLDLADPIQRDAYIQRLASRLGSSPRAVALTVSAVARELRGQHSPQPAAHGRASKGSDLEAHLIAILSRRPALLLDANVALTRANLDVLSEADFSNPALRAGFRQLSRAALGASPLPDDEAEDWLTIIADEDSPQLASDDEALLREALIRTALRLRERNLARDRLAISLMIAESKQAGQPNVAAHYNADLQRVLTHQLRVHKALHLRSALPIV